jgi:hypothetical protein
VERIFREFPLKEEDELTVRKKRGNAAAELDESLVDEEAMRQGC